MKQAILLQNDYQSLFKASIIFIIIASSFLQLSIFKVVTQQIIHSLKYLSLTVCFDSLHKYMKSESESHSIMSNSLQHHGLYSPWNSPGQDTGMGSLSLLQRIFPIQGSNPGLPYCKQILYQLSHQGSPRISLSPLQRIFLTQELNRGLLHCRQILDQLSY